MRMASITTNTTLKKGTALLLYTCAITLACSYDVISSVFSLYLFYFFDLHYIYIHIWLRTLLNFWLKSCENNNKKACPKKGPVSLYGISKVPPPGS